MKRKKGHWMDAVQILLSLAIAGASLLLIFDWKTYEICFCIVFGLASVLFALIGISSVAASRKKSRYGFAALYFLITMVMIGMFTGSILAWINV